jgi:ribosomal protein S21
MVEIKRKKGESFEAMIRKFNKKILQSGKVFQAKKIRYELPKVNKNKRHSLKLRRMEINAEKEWLKKTGRIKED